MDVGDKVEVLEYASMVNVSFSDIGKIGTITLMENKKIAWVEIPGNKRDWIIPTKYLRKVS